MCERRVLTPLTAHPLRSLTSGFVVAYAAIRTITKVYSVLRLQGWLIRLLIFDDRPWADSDALSRVM